MGVRLASALTTGFLVCIVSDIQSDDPKAPIGLGQIEGQYITSLTTSAAHDPHCHDQVGPQLNWVSYILKVKKLAHSAFQSKIIGGKSM